MFFREKCAEREGVERQFRWRCTLGRPRLFVPQGVINGRCPTVERLGSGGIYSLAIIASANETSVLSGAGRDAPLLRRCCGRGKDDCKRCSKGWIYVVYTCACVWKHGFSVESWLAQSFHSLRHFLDSIVFSSAIIARRLEKECVSSGRNFHQDNNVASSCSACEIRNSQLSNILFSIIISFYILCDHQEARERHWSVIASNSDFVIS